MKEVRVYSVDSNEYNGKELTDEQFMRIAEIEGNVWSIEGFQKCFNEGWQCPSPDSSYIRFIEVEI